MPNIINLLQAMSSRYGGQRDSSTDLGPPVILGLDLRALRPRNKQGASRLNFRN